jgi:hypothetical protein
MLFFLAVRAYISQKKTPTSLLPFQDVTRCAQFCGYLELGYQHMEFSCVMALSSMGLQNTFYNFLFIS